VIGGNFEELMFVGVLLQSEFAYVSLIHSKTPMARAAIENADVTIVLVDEVCTTDEMRAAVEANRVVVAVVEACVENSAELKAAGALVAPAGQPALLQAIVASLVAQVVVNQ
jgi:hypothetical protein